ncbi:hypothetical protein MNBD_NITROSPINAE01-1505 [hydrothermal vent metagenome]|uniref:Co/Zn/Cd efflux system membrane fusion protein n=1 Tax=hydrothermal vent metagenome TaxID=652676 RepID=A0A3B1CHR9_9ZZZZ
MKKFLAFIIIISGLTIGYMFYGENSGTQLEEFKTINVERKNLDMLISASGIVEPNFFVEVKSKASGKVLDFPYEPGDKVTIGERLLILDPGTELRSKAQSEADLARATAELQSAMADLVEKTSKLARARALSAKNLLSAEKMEAVQASAAQAKAHVGTAEAAVRKAKLFVEDAQERLADTEILSPINGILIEKFVERGQIISSGITSFSGGTPLCSVADLSRIFIMASVDETDIGQVAVGQKANITVDAYPEKVFNGVVTRAYPMGEAKDNITIFKVKVEATDQKRNLLKPKMTANVDMIVKSKSNVLVIPDETIKTGKDDHSENVYVLENGSPVKRGVTIGISNGFDTEILTGLSEGEKVLLRDPDKKK